jgi:recombinational DNA repair protein RecR
MNFSSKLLENAVAEFAKLPGVGQKTALRLVLHLLNQDKEDVQKFNSVKPVIIYLTSRFARSAHRLNGIIA